jgi:cobyrinic acid a,c-diamide synthase
VIAGASSGIGKTSIALGIVRALAGRGLRVRTFKVGPDFLDPTYLARASGRTCYNLDGWMTSRDYVRDLFARATAGADLAVVEGVMGLFDGASPTDLSGSTAEIALWLGAPVVLVVNAHGAVRSLAAVVKGFASFEPSLTVAGVIANQSGSERHAQWLRESLAAANLPPLLGAVPSGALPALPSRHLGLVTADANALPDGAMDELARACAKHLDLDTLLHLAGGDAASEATEPPRAAALGLGEGTAPFAARLSEPPDAGNDGEEGNALRRRRCRIAVARDEAFHFYYGDNLEVLRDLGAELAEFSPLRDRQLPPGAGAVYLGGGYPEVHAEALSANSAMREAIAGHARRGGAIYAECGGLMYLARGLTTLDGRRHEMAGVLPVETAMLKRLAALGYVEADACDGTLWSGGGSAGTLRGHEFHYSHIVADESAREGWGPAYRLRRGRADACQAEGFARGAVLASYVHVHFASRPGRVEQFLSRCEVRP